MVLVGLGPRSLLPADCAQDARLGPFIAEAPGPQTKHLGEGLALFLSRREGWQAPPLQHRSDHMFKERPRSDKGAVCYLGL